MLISTCLCRDHAPRTARLGDAARFVADASRRTDPTGTSSLRRGMDMDLTRRWRALRNNITDAVEKSDLLHLRALTQAGMLGSLSSRPQYNHAIPHGDVVGGFETWLGTIMRQTVLGENGDWTRPYVQRAVAHAKTRVHALTRQVPTVSQHRLMTLESSIIAELRGVASAVAQQCSRVAAQAVLGRWRPARAAREMVRVVRDVGERRGAMMTDYAIVKAFNSGTLDALRNLGHRTVGVKAERVRVVQTTHGKALADARGVKGPGSRVPKSRTPSASTIGRIEKVQEKLEALGEVEVLTAGDDDVCPECEDISDNGPYDIDEAESLIPAHPWCVLPGQFVEGAVLAALKSRYSGPAFTIETKTGKRLRVTGQHPVLTTGGWIAAQDLAKGDQLVSKRDNVRGTLSPFIDANEHDAPALIEKIFDTFAAHGACFVKPSCDDFHGDGEFIEGQVCVAFANRTLLRNFETTLSEFHAELGLKLADASESLEVSLSSCQSSRERLSAAAPSSVRRDSLPPTLRRGHLGPFQALRLGSAANWNVAKIESSLESPAAHAEFVGALFERCASDIQLDEVVDIERFAYAGHVYDLQTVTGHMVASGIVISNCRCAYMPVEDVSEDDVLDAAVADADDQPRDEHGRWASSGGHVVAYHGTGSQFTRGIMSKGLTRERNFIGSTQAVAHRFAMQNVGRNEHTGKMTRPVILTLHIPRDVFNRAHADPFSHVYAHQGRGVFLTRSVPREWIKSAHEIGRGGKKTVIE